MVLYGKHFDEQAWFRWTAANDTVSGECEFCGVSMGPMKGVAKHMRLQHHILRKCAKYMPASPIFPASSMPPTALLPAVPPPPQLAPPSPPSSQAQPFISEYARMRYAVKLKPVMVKKKTGKYNCFNHLYLDLDLYVNMVTIDLTCK